MSDDISKLEGRELDTAVAVEVFGHTITYNTAGTDGEEPPFTVYNGGFGPMRGEIPHYSTDPTAAWQVRAAVKKWMFSKRLGFSRSLQLAISERMNITPAIHPDEIFLHVEPQDICRAALTVVRNHPRGITPPPEPAP